MRIAPLASSVALTAALLPGTAHAVGFVAGTSDGKLATDAASILAVREGTRTVVGIALDVSGPEAPLAVVLPVPKDFTKDHVRALPRATFERLEAFTSPRVVETWEQDPCADAVDGGARDAGVKSPPKPLPPKNTPPKPLTAGAAEAPSTGDYTVELLGGADSIALDAWLKNAGYRVPESAEGVLRPYADGGRRFVVARIDASKLAWKDGHTRLPPLALVVDDESFKLPVRAALASAGPSLDVTVTVVGASRFMPLSGEAAALPKGVELLPGAFDARAAAYGAVFEKTAASAKATWVEEHAGPVGVCTECVVDALTLGDLGDLGAEPPPRPVDTMLPLRVSLGTPEISGSVKDPARGLASAETSFKLCYADALKEAPETRGTMRLTATLVDNGEVTTATSSAVQGLPEKLVRCVEDKMKSAHFAQLPEGSRAGLSFAATFTPPRAVLGPKSAVATRLHARVAKGSALEELSLKPAEANAQGASGARYELKHAFDGAVACPSPKRGVWGGPPEGGEAKVTPIATTATAAKGAELAKLFAADVPSIGLERSGKPSAPAASAITAPVAPSAVDTPAPPPPPATGCALTARRGGASGALAAASALAALMVLRRRRR